MSPYHGDVTFISPPPRSPWSPCHGGDTSIPLPPWPPQSPFPGGATPIGNPSLSPSLSATTVPRGAGTGGLGLAIEGPSEAKMSCKDNKDGSCTVEYIPFTPGDYDVNITFGGHPIPGAWGQGRGWGLPGVFCRAVPMAVPSPLSRCPHARGGPIPMVAPCPCPPAVTLTVVSLSPICPRAHFIPTLSLCPNCPHAHVVLALSPCPRCPHTVPMPTFSPHPHIVPMPTLSPLAPHCPHAHIVPPVPILSPCRR